MKTGGLAALMMLLAVGLAGCKKENGYDPITLPDVEGSTVEMFWLGEHSGVYTWRLRGGDGNYSVRSDDARVAAVENMQTRDADLYLKPTGLGETTVTVTDGAGNSFALTVRVKYETHRFVVTRHDVTVAGGDDMTPDEMRAIREWQLAEMPVKVGGGYEFTFTDFKDAVNGGGTAVVYPEKFGSGGIETTFERREVGYASEGGDFGTYTVYEVVMDGEKRIFAMIDYIPSHQSEESTRLTFVNPLALIEVVTEKVRAEYPRVVSAYTSQVFVY